MAIPSSGQVSTTNLENEFGSVQSTKTMDAYLSVINSTTKHTSQFYSKAKPSISSFDVEYYDEADIYLTGNVNGGNISNCRFRYQVSTSYNFNTILGSTGYTIITGSGTLNGSITIGNNHPVYYIRIQANFGSGYAYVINSSPIQFSPSNY